MKHWFRVAMVGALAALPAAHATADVVYTLDEALPTEAGLQATLTLPTFISADTVYPISDFSVSSNPDSYLEVEFEPDTSNPVCSISFSLNSCDLINLTTVGGGAYYGYAPGTFSTTGQTNAVDGVFSMVLTVSETSVPEPSTVALFATGLLGLGLVFRRRA